MPTRLAFIPDKQGLSTNQTAQTAMKDFILSDPLIQSVHDLGDMVNNRQEPGQWLLSRAIHDQIGAQKPWTVSPGCHDTQFAESPNPPSLEFHSWYSNRVTDWTSTNGLTSLRFIGDEANNFHYGVLSLPYYFTTDSASNPTHVDPRWPEYIHFLNTFFPTTPIILATHANLSVLANPTPEMEYVESYAPNLCGHLPGFNLFETCIYPFPNIICCVSGHAGGWAGSEYAFASYMRKNSSAKYVPVILANCQTQELGPTPTPHGCIITLDIEPDLSSISMATHFTSNPPSPPAPDTTSSPFNRTFSI